MRDPELGSGDPLQLLWLEYGPAVHAYLRRRCPGPDAEDLLSDVFVVAARRLAAIPQGRELPWLYGVARTLLRAHWRVRSVEADTLARTGQQSASAEHWDADPAMRPDVRALLSGLSAADLEVLLLVAWEGCTGVQLADALNCTPLAARLRLYRARRALSRAELASEGLAADSSLPTLSSPSLRGPVHDSGEAQ